MVNNYQSPYGQSSSNMSSNIPQFQAQQFFPRPQGKCVYN